MSKRLIKEAYGCKSFNKLEIAAGMILFKPSLALSTTYDHNKNARGLSLEAHTMVLPLLKIPQ